MCVCVCVCVSAYTRLPIGTKFGTHMQIHLEKIYKFALNRNEKIGKNTKRMDQYQMTHVHSSGNGH